MRSQSVTAAENTKVMGSQSVTALQSKRNNAQTPYAFTEQGVAMLRGVLNSDKAIDMNVAIMRAFIAIKKIVINQNNFKLQMEEIKEKLGEHDTRLNQIYETMENLLDEKVSQRKWEQRQRIGFNK